MGRFGAHSDVASLDGVRKREREGVAPIAERGVTRASRRRRRSLRRVCSSGTRVEGGPKTQRKVHCTGEPSLPPSLPSAALGGTVIFCLDRTPRGGKIHRGPIKLGQVFLGRHPGAVGERRAGIALHRSRSPLLLLYRSYIHSWRCCVTDEGGTPRPSYVTYDIITVGRPQACAAHPRTPYASLPRSLGGCQQCQVASANQHDMNSNLAPPSRGRERARRRLGAFWTWEAPPTDPAPTRGSNTARC